jgi:two-component system chemotaxis response regulator CheB
LPSRLVVVASSTGGPSALIEVVPHLPGGLDVGYLLVQHMPAGFTRSLAERLDRASQVEVREAADGDRVQAGLALMAPGGFHMGVGGDGCIRLLQTPSIHGVRPAADVTMQAVSKLSGRAAVGVVLTGMGMDGTAGCGHIRAAGGVVIAQDESTCTVFGMPKSVIDAGYANTVAPVGHVASEIVRAVRGSDSEAAG